MVMGRPKKENSKSKGLYIKLTVEEFEEISMLAKKLNLSKSEVILRGIKLLKNPPRQIITRSQLPGYKPPTKKIQNSPGIVADDD